MTARATKTVPLGRVGGDYLRGRLADVNHLCRFLLERVGGGDGEVFTVAADNTALERLLRFEEGGLLPSRGVSVHALDGSLFAPVPSMLEEQVKLIRHALSETPGAVCLVDDYNPSWSASAASVGPDAFSVEDEVYHLLANDRDDQRFAEVIRTANVVWHGVTAVCARRPVLNPRRTSTPTELQKSAATARLVTCAAYDGEGFIAWRAVGA